VSSPKPGTRGGYSEDTQIRAGDNGGSARGYLAVGGASQQSGMAYLMIVCSVYLYIAILGANVRICRCASVLQMIRYTPGAAVGCCGGRVVLLS
jgi:hypothetical protein